MRSRAVICCWKRWSTKITQLLTDCIISQSEDLPDAPTEHRVKTATIKKVKEAEEIRSNNLKAQQTPELQRALEQHSQPGASSWLGALPIAAQGFNLNKGEFQDALCLRYLTPIKNLPSHCPCGEKYDRTHALNCMRGGFVNARHDGGRSVVSGRTHCP